MDSAALSRIDYDKLASSIAKLGVSLQAGHASSDAGVEGGGVALASCLQGGRGVAEAYDDTDAGSDASSTVSGGAPGVIGEQVRRAVRFGGLADDVKDVSSGRGVKFYADVVRSAATRDLRAFVERGCQARLPKAAMADLALCCYTAGTVPASFESGKVRLRSLAAVGDAVLTAHLSVASLAAGRTVESAQALRSRTASDASLSSLSVASGLSKFVSFAPGVDPGTSKSGATALEAVVGVVALYRPASAVNALLRFLAVL